MHGCRGTDSAGAEDGKQGGTSAKTAHHARGNQVVVISANDEEDEKLLRDKKYFDEFVGQLRSVIETLEIINDQKFFQQILSAAESLQQNTRRGKLHSFEEASEER